MKISLWPTGLDIVCETPDDWRSVVVHCVSCGRAYRHPPSDEFCKTVKKLNGVPDDELKFVQCQKCALCTDGVAKADRKKQRKKMVCRMPESVGMRYGDSRPTREATPEEMAAIGC